MMLMIRRKVFCYRLVMGLSLAMVVSGMGFAGVSAQADPLGMIKGMDQPFLLIDRRLNELMIDLEKIEAGMLAYWDRQTVARKQSAGGVLALIRQKVARGEGDVRRDAVWSGPVLTLTDGRVFTGRLMEVVDDDNERVIWRNDFLGTVVTPLEKVREIYLRPSAGEMESGLKADDENGDVIELVNGDRLSGFIAAIGRKRVVIEVDGGNEVAVEMARVSRLIFENEVERPAEDACWVWIDDGSIVEVEAGELLVRDGALRMMLAGRTEERWVSFVSVDAVVYGVGALGGLAGVEVSEDEVNDGGSRWFGTPVSAVVGGGGVGAWERELPCGLGDVLYAGPGEVRYALPPGVVRFASGVEIPRFALDWADLELVLLVDGVEQYREHFDVAESAGRVVFGLEKGGRELVIRLEEGGHGPIQDMVRLVRPMFLISK